MKTRNLFFPTAGWRRVEKPVAAMLAWCMLAAPAMAQLPMPVPPGISEFEEVGAPAAPQNPAPTPPARPGGGREEKLLQLNFRDSPLDQVLDFIAELKGKTIIKSPGVNASITLKSQTRLNVQESMIALEAILSMHNITLVPMGDKFLRAVQTGQARQEGMAIRIGLPEEGFRETDALISQIFTLKHIELAEIQAVIQGFLHGYGKIQPLERANSLMVTDTESNLARITELLDFLDQPVEAKIETRIYEIRYAEASQVAGKLNELIADSQAKEERPQIAVPEAMPSIPSPPGVIRARQAQQQAQQAGSEIEAAMQMAERGIVTGKVRIIADDRTNILFVISRTENFVFFDRIVEVLDRPIDPAITVRVVALEYAKAEEIAGILNEFIGAASAEKSGTARAGPSDTDAGATDARSLALRDFIRARTEQRATAEPAAPGQTAIGRLSPETKILADKRTNSLLMMGKLRDLAVLEDLIDHLDIMLAQVVIEAVIIEVGLSDEIRSGIDWVQKSMLAYNQAVVGPGGGLSVVEPVAAWGGGTSLGAGVPRDATTIADASSISSGGLNWYMSIFDLNIDAVIRLAANSRNAQILSTPVIVTTDNTEAKIIASTQRPVVTTTSTTDGGSIRSSYEYRDIGINLTVTPRINPQRMVVMEVNQTADDVAGEILIDGNLVPEITKRELNATVAVGDRSTIVLGGLILSRNAKSETKVPLLGDIPVLGRLFKFKSDQRQRSELVVLLTPYVLMTPAEARAESTRLYSANSSRQREWHTGWSDSPFGKMTDREKARYLEDWEKNRPVPYTRDLSINLFDDKAAPGNAAKPPRRTLMNINVSEDESVTPDEDPGEPAPDAPVAVEEEASPAPASAPVIDYNAPAPVR
ncbi:MAG TPA: type II secretion system secretin GspD [Kiritimatiellia bacterium]|nr:type II secretion system secretin GspD [Kiritimatiellia bacterium]HMO98194.1 type II secretion system secretin GspD [Kiritimatiellia bacterium]HMP96488.1 type II secretion system secretin GspD [Kiritimatiellia bacterium]